jgi:cyclic-di-GMP-binding protein
LLKDQRIINHTNILSTSQQSIFHPSKNNLYLQPNKKNQNPFMPSFDIQSKVDVQTLDNAINSVNREISTRYDFKGTHVLIELDKKAFVIKLEVDSEMKLEQLIDVLITRSMRSGLDGNALDVISKEHYPSGKIIKKEVPVKNGLSQEDAKKIVKLIKESGIKVQAAIMDDMVRVTSKKIDDLQAVIALCNQADLKFPLQYTNMKS